MRELVIALVSNIISGGFIEVSFFTFNLLVDPHSLGLSYIAVKFADYLAFNI